MKIMLSEKYYTVAQAAELAGVTVSYVRLLLRQDKIKGEKIGERAWVIPISQLAKLKNKTDNIGRPRTGKK